MGGSCRSELQREQSQGAAQGVAKQKQVDELVAERVKWLSELQHQRSTANSALDRIEVSKACNE